MITPADIETGLKQHEFCLYYQPKFSLSTGRVEGSEALLRWIRPDGSMPSPAAFITLAEQSSLIKEISAYIVPLLFGDLPLLSEHNFAPVSFNLTARDFEDENLTRQILLSVTTSGVSPAQLEVEITEGDALASGDNIFHNIVQLRMAGMGLSMDDYGIGYSSVDTLSRWPFSTIKIDQGLIGRMLGNEKNARIVRSAIRLAHELEMDVVAEGVESEEQYRFLADAGCKKVQGYLISKPLSLESLLAMPQPYRQVLPVGRVHMFIMDHLKWRKDLYAYAMALSVLAPDAPARRSAAHPTLSLSECALKVWCDTEGQPFSHLPAFRAMDDALIRIANAASDVVTHVRQGAGRDETLERLKAVKRSFDDVLENLTALENYGLATVFQQTLH